MEFTTSPPQPTGGSGGLTNGTASASATAGDTDTDTDTGGTDTTGTETTGGPPPSCGDGMVDAGEECDQGAKNSESGLCTPLCTLATCGDGYVYPAAESCDEGMDNAEDAGCLPDCTMNTCGDGFLYEGVEECDDGNTEDHDGCTSECQIDLCGNGEVDFGETCDDGNQIDTDACLSTCEAASCGDGFVQAGVEECDDANEANDDACLTVCLAAACGDGVLHVGVEECDDGNLDPDDECNAACVRDRLVFVTSEPLQPGDFGSLFLADNHCRKVAMDAGLTNYQDFKAWLSDGEESPSTRFFHSAGRYVQVTGEVVAENWEDLTDGELTHGIDRTITGVLQYETAVWTGTRPNGEGSGEGLHCENWTNSSPEVLGRQGVSGFTDAVWTDFDSVFCGIEAFLYCVEQ